MIGIGISPMIKGGSGSIPGDSTWILAEGFWNDSHKWIDAEVWID